MCPKATQTRMPYLIVMFVGVIACIIFRYASPNTWVIDLYLTNWSLCKTDACVGQEAVYRMSAALFVFFAVHALCMLCQGTRGIHYKYWCFKWLALPLLVILFFLIPNAPFDIYAIVARFVSGLFLLLQIIILIDFAYSWNANWMSDEKMWWKQLAAVAVCLYAASIIVAVYSFRWFTDGLSSFCKLEQFFIGFTIALTLLVTLVSITEKFCKHGSILTSGVVTLYSFYLCYNALQSDPSPCNTLASQSTAQVVIGIIIAAAAVCYAGWNLSNADNIFGVDPSQKVESITLSDGNNPAAANTTYQQVCGR